MSGAMIDTNDCPDHAGGTCEPFPLPPGEPAWECDPSDVFDFWQPMARVPYPDHPGASLDCATTEDSP